MIRTNQTFVKGLVITALFLGCNGETMKPLSNTSASELFAKRIADGLHSPNGVVTPAMRDSLESLTLTVDDSTIESLVSLHWDDTRPSACDQIWSIYAVVVPDSTGLLSDANKARGGTVGDCIYLCIEQLTSSTVGKGVTKDELRKLLEENGFNLYLTRQQRTE